MYDFELIKSNYLKLRSALIKYLDRFDEEGYFYQPTEKSNATAWIIPHIVAFEKMMVTDRITGFKFSKFISQENVDKYKPTVDGFAFTKDELLPKEDAIVLLEKSKEVLLKFLEDIIHDVEAVSKVDKDAVFSKFMLNFGHETEHYGQIKYLLGTYNRLKS